MSDAINLVELAQRIKRLKRANRFRWGILVAILVYLILITLVLFQTPAYSSTQGKCNCAAFLFSVLPLITIIGVVIVFAINRMKHRKLIGQYLAEVKALDLPTVPSQLRSPLGAFLILWVVGSMIVSTLLTHDIGLGFIFVYVPIVVFGFLLSWTTTPLYRGQYDLTIKRWLLLLNFPLLRGLRPTSSYSLAYIFSDHFAESEKVQRYALAVHQSAKVFEAVALNNYGSELLFQGRYGEAKRLLELAILIQPEIPVLYEGLASWYLSQGLDANRAVELMEFALQLPMPFYLSSKEASRGINLITYAWAKAKVGDVANAKKAMQEALKFKDQKNVPYFSVFMYTAGQVELILGNQAKATDYFMQVIGIDRQGRFEKFAEQALITIK